MKKRQTKRTAGERRYRALKRKAEDAISVLGFAQQRMTQCEREGLSMKPIAIMQYITEAKEKLRHDLSK